MDESRLRPLERRVLRMDRGGMSRAEIARRFRRSPGFIGRVVSMAELPRPTASAGSAGDAAELRPLERRILRWRDAGVGYAEIASRFRRSPEFIRRVEGYARARQSVGEAPAS